MVDSTKAILVNVPKFITAKEITPKLNELFKEFPHPFKIAKNPKKEILIISFFSQDILTEFEKFLTQNGFIFPRCKKPLCLRPLASKTKVSVTDNFYAAKGNKEEILDQVCKFGRFSYPEQLELKKKAAQTLVSKINSALYVEDIIPSPITSEYRNKCEFTIGLGGLTGTQPVVGFTMGTFQERNFSVFSPESLPIIHPAMKQFVSLFEKWIIDNFYQSDGITPIDSEMGVYNRITNVGFWRLLLLRIMDNGKMMASLLVSSYEPRVPFKDPFKNFCHSFSWTSPGGIEFTIESVSYQPSSSLSLNFDFSKPVFQIYGPTALPITLLGYKFDVSISSFFQVNPSAAEALFNAIHSLLCNTTDGAFLLDLCCGTGTIGITLSKLFDKVAYSSVTVIGIEIIQEAIEDAKNNALKNQLEHKTEWLAGPVEKVLPSVLAKYSDNSEEFVAILDPPRNGVKKQVIQLLRSVPRIKRIVYISCKADLAVGNFEDLSRTTSKKYPGDPFKIKKAIPVDMFPHTDHYELILVFERP